MKTIVVIPARWGSTRFEGKPLAKINGKEVIKYVWEKANLSKLAQEVIVATDDKRIKNFCMNEGIKVLMTSKSNKTGTDRIYEVSKKINFDMDKINLGTLAKLSGECIKGTGNDSLAYKNVPIGKSKKQGSSVNREVFGGNTRSRCARMDNKMENNYEV